MIFKLRVSLSLATLFFVAAFPAFSQVAPAASGGGLPLVVGAGFSDFYTDWNRRITGPTLWVNWNFYSGPRLLHGFGIEAEGRDLNYGRTGSDAKLRQDTIAGGPIYTWRHYHNFHPYGKFLMGYGSIDFNINAPHYSHDSRTVFAPGGGVEYRVSRNVWVRGDYEYQFWTDFFNHHALNPNGLTVGVSYDFRHAHFRRTQREQ